MTPPGGAEPILGTNPLAIGIPTKHDAIIIDMSTSVVSRGKILECLQKGLKIKKGWAVDERGEVTEDPEAALRGALLPMAEHKGFCLALGIDVLTGALAGASVGKDVKGTLHAEEFSTKGDFFTVINPDMFCGLRDFLDRVELLKRQIKSCKKAFGTNNIYLPGERSRSIIRNRRMQEGIPVEEKLWNNLIELKMAVCGDQ
jgi:L-2-hydroxycarboxylate dehydrogenase (NAD+)